MKLQQFKLRHLILGLALASGHSLAGQAEIDAIEQAARTGDAKTLSAMAHTLTGYDQALAQYRLAADYQWADFEEKANKTLDAAIANIKALEIGSELPAEAAVLLAHCYGFKIKTNPAQSKRFIFLSTLAREKARSQAPNNPRLALIDGINLFYTPVMFGGGKEKAIAAFNKALQAFPADETSGTHWGKAETLIWRGLAEQALAQPEQARASWEQALSLHGDFNWAKMLLRTLEAADATY